MSDQKHTPVKTLTTTLMGSLIVALSLTACGGDQKEVTGDTSAIEERVQKVGSVNTNDPAPAPAAEVPAATAAAPEAAPAASPEAATATQTPATQTATAAAPVAAAPAGGAVDGKAVYNKSCLACHMAGVANAPKLGDKAAWEPRIAKGMDALLKSAINGVPGTAMPARGTCATCSDEELKAAVVYMTGQ